MMIAHPFLLLLPLLALSANATAAGGISEVSIRVVAATGQQAPGFPVGENFELFGVAPTFGMAFAVPAIDSDGNVAFLAYLDDGIPQTNCFHSAGIWLETSTGLEGVAFQNDPAPGTSSTPSGMTTQNDTGSAPATRLTPRGPSPHSGRISTKFDPLAAICVTHRAGCQQNAEALQRPFSRRSLSCAS